MSPTPFTANTLDLSAVSGIDDPMITQLRERGRTTTLDLSAGYAQYVPQRPGGYLRLSMHDINEDRRARKEASGRKSAIERQTEDIEAKRQALGWGPFGIADEVPALAERPDAHLEELYAMLTAAGYEPRLPGERDGPRLTPGRASRPRHGRHDPRTRRSNGSYDLAISCRSCWVKRRRRSTVSRNSARRSSLPSVGRVLQTRRPRAAARSTVSLSQSR